DKGQHVLVHQQSRNWYLDVWSTTLLETGRFLSTPLSASCVRRWWKRVTSIEKCRDNHSGSDPVASLPGRRWTGRLHGSRSANLQSASGGSGRTGARHAPAPDRRDRPCVGREQRDCP